VLLAADDDIRAAPQFTLASAPTSLGSWLDAGLPYYSGSAAYETVLDIPPHYLGRRLTLVCGEVGVVAEVRINGQPAGERVWSPYAFDISTLVKPGRNQLSILVTNTMANERAVLERAAHLPRLRLSGLLGPVRVVAAEPLPPR
jgi:hypothetical protein